MIDIRTEVDAPLDLDGNASISITAVNPALDTNKTARSFSLPFTLPGTPNNMRLRRHSNRLDGARQNPTQRGTIRFGTHLIAEGLIKPISVTPTSEEVAFQSEVTNIWTDLEKIKISEILDTIHPAYVGTVAQWVFQFDPAPNTYSITLQGVTATATASGNTNFDRDIAGFNIAQQLNAVIPGVAGYSGGTLTLASYLVNAYPVIQNVSMDLISVDTVGQLAQENMRQHVNDVVLNGADTHCFPTIQWQGLYGDKVVSFFRNNVNGWSNGELELNTAVLESDFFDYAWGNTIIPMVRVPYILEKIRQKVGMESWQGAFWAADDLQALFVVNNYTLDNYYKDRNIDNEIVELNGYTQEINFNNHVPEISAAEFIQSICDTFNLELRVLGKSLMFIPNINQLRNNPVEMTKKATINFQRSVTDPAGWSLIYKKNPAEKEVPTNGQLGEIIKAPGKNIRYIVPTMAVYDFLEVWNEGTAKMPRTNQPGVSGVFQTEKRRSNMPLTFLFDRGLQTTSSGATYPFCTHDNKTRTGVIVGDWSLDISGIYGLYELCHKGHIELSDADKISMEFTLHAGDIQKIQTWENARVRVYNALGEFIGVIESLSYSLTLDGVSLTKLVMRKQ